MKILFYGNVMSTERLLLAAAEVPGVKIVGLVTRRSSRFNADHVDVGRVAEGLNIPVFYVDDLKANDERTFVESVDPDIIYCFGWSKLLPKEVLAIPALGCVGFHPAALPANRGRHPLIWALVLGLEATASTFFLMHEDADSGAILDQRRVSIEPEDDSAELYKRVLSQAVDQVRDFTPKLLNGTACFVEQDDKTANVWRKRTAADGRIDWRMPAEGVHNLVRALAPPYPGADLSMDGADYKIWKTRLGPVAPANFEPGKIMNIRAGEILVKCYDRAIWIVDHDIPDASLERDYL